MPRISDLTSYTAPSNSDLLAIVDMAGAVTKKITRADLLKGTALPADTVDTQAIADEAVTPAKWTNPYCFKAHVSTTYNTTPTATTKLALGTKLYDPNTNFSTTTSTYTAPVAGIYRFNANFQTGGSSSSRMFLTLFKNGTEIVRGEDRSVATFAATVTADIQLAATDTVDVRYYVADTIPVSANFQNTALSGSLIHKL